MKADKGPRDDGESRGIVLEWHGSKRWGGLLVADIVSSLAPAWTGKWFAVGIPQELDSMVSRVQEKGA
jgi:hypothetical protein